MGDREERMGIKDDAKCYRGLGEENGLDMKSLGVAGAARNRSCPCVFGLRGVHVEVD